MWLGSADVPELTDTGEWQVGGGTRGEWGLDCGRLASRLVRVREPPDCSDTTTFKGFDISPH